MRIDHNPSYSQEELAKLSVEEQTDKLLKLNLDEQMVVIKDIHREQTLKELTRQCQTIDEEAVTEGVKTEEGKPDLLKLFGGSLAYVNLLEMGTASLLKQDLKIQDEGSQQLTNTAIEFEQRISQIKKDLLDTSSLIED